MAGNNPEQVETASDIHAFNATASTVLDGILGLITNLLLQAEVDNLKGEVQRLNGDVKKAELEASLAKSIAISFEGRLSKLDARISAIEHKPCNCGSNENSAAKSSGERNIEGGSRLFTL